MNIKIKLLIILLFLVPVVVADNTQILIRDTVREEIQNSNREVLNKIQKESDLCYKNIEDATTGYFWELREDFKKVAWLDRVITFIGIYISMVLGLMTTYFFYRRCERKKEVLKHARPKAKTKKKEVVKRGK